MSNIFLQPNAENFDEFLDYAVKNDYNLEIASFAFAAVLDSNWKEIMKDYKNKLKKFEGRVSLHGAFQDIIIHSRDIKIQNISKERIFQNLLIAKELNAEYIVFHGNFNPLIRHLSYEKNWVEQNAKLWHEAIERYDITILIENVWETSPGIFLNLINAVNSPKLKICFDTGHANIFSEVPLEEWFSCLRDNIAYIHINDNEGKFDNEMVPGDGNINWHEFSDLINKYKINPVYVFEVGSLEKSKRSIQYFRENKICNF